uniref:phage tail length tape measure family protein n=1 Tax=Ningiella ruwaisensis TaxID=2364274 RepID=UPI00109F9E29|nr:phage tail length tape measure family protein [Ningiella ruwaisensis]
MAKSVLADLVTRMTVESSQFKRELEKTTAKTHAWSKAQKQAANDAVFSNQRLSKSFASSNKSSGAFRQGIQQAGFQIQDFAVQVGGGTNALQAFGQQGSQLAGIFGPTGAIVGAVIAIGSVIGVSLAPAIFDAKDATEELSESMDKLSEIAVKGQDGLYDFTDGLRELAKVGNTVVAAELEAALIRAEIASSAAAKGITTALNEIDADFGFSGIQDYVDAINNADKSSAVYVQSQKGFIEVSQELGEQLGKTGEEARALGASLIQSIADLETTPTAENFDALQTKLSELATAGSNVSDEVKLIVSDLKLFFADAKVAAETTEFLTQKLEELRNKGSLAEAIGGNDSALSLVQGLNQEIAIASLNLSGSVDEANKLAFAFSNGATSFEDLPKEAQYLYTQLQLINQAQAESVRLSQEQASNVRNLSELNRVLGGDVSLEEQNQARIAKIQELNLSEQDIAAAGYDSLLELQQDYISRSNALYNQQIADREEKSFALFEAELQRAEQEKALKQQEVKTNQQIARDDFFSNLQIAGQKNSKLAAIAKAGAIANATIKTYEAVNTALAAPYPPPIPQAFAAAALAAGLANVAAIRSTPVAGARELGGPVYSGQTYLVGERGPELFTPNGTGQITSNKDLIGSMNNQPNASNMTINLSVMSRRPDDIMDEINSVKKPLTRLLASVQGRPL